MDPCPDRAEVASLLARGEDDDEARRAHLEAHLEGCGSCRSALDELAGSIEPETLILIRSIDRESSTLILDRAPVGEDESTLDPTPDAMDRLRELAPPWGPEGWRGRLMAPLRPTVPGVEIEEEIGRGGMGAVYRGRQVSTGRTVAVKFLFPSRLASREGCLRARRGVRALAGLDHPHIVRLLEYGEHDGLFYGLLEYLEGGSLDHRIGDRPWPAREAAELVRSLAGALAYLHEKGIIHRDLKASNVLLDADGSPRIADFGLARPIGAEEEEVTESGVVLGTPSAMAPEQAAGRIRAVGPATDIHAVGIILYELLAGRPPFSADSRDELLRQIIEVVPLPPSRFRPDVPAALEAICLKCLRKDPRQRYADARTLVADLSRFLDGEAVKVAPVPARERFRSAFSGRRAWLMPLLVALVVLLLLGNTRLRLSRLRERRAADGVVKARLEESEARHYADRLDAAERELGRGDREAARAILAEFGPIPGRPDRRDGRWRALWERASGPDGR